MTRNVSLIGAPIETGASQRGCLMGPDSLRTAGIVETLQALNWSVKDLGDVTIPPAKAQKHKNSAIHHLAETIAWIEALQTAAYAAAQNSDMPIFLGGDHSMSAGTIPGIARHAKELDRPLFVLWLDAHPDLHNLESTQSGNLHGTPVAYFTGQDGLDAYPERVATVAPENVMMMGIRSVDPHERAQITKTGIRVHDMRSIDEQGVLKPLNAFLDLVRTERGLLHVSFDVDFLEPDIAPGVGTTVPGGATFREAHLIMETLNDSGLVSSLDLVELNPFLDDRGRTASLLCDLTASLMGRRVLDRPTRRYA